MPGMTLQEMNLLLEKSRFSPPLARIAHRHSASDLQILEAKAQILSALPTENDRDLFSPGFRNVSMFKRSYELMEKVLKVYVYTEGDKPIFRQPELKGVYSSEGWFMKQLLASQRFVVKDPSKAHLFYVPFSSSTLRSSFFIPGDHSHDRAIEYLKNYTSMIAGKYPFWNRTGGADHFFAACHDWVPDITVPTMGNSIAAICNADLAVGFVMGRDVSLPETYVKRENNPSPGTGRRATNKRPILAFFAGKMHGYLRPMLVHHWENKYPDMKISGALAKNKTTMTYAEHMKSSKYCICPRGSDVNSPRLVEAILYECVPVIISDNFVPPLFEVLNWETFSVVVLEKDVPRLREILLSIPMKRYSALRTAGKKVQRHFIWHSQPQRYDLFHMVLHSIWLSRVLQQF
ncbi:putative glycosyltransferase At5g03795 isoform X2 [Wolffia australiana]